MEKLENLVFKLELRTDLKGLATISLKDAYSGLGRYWSGYTN